MRHVPHVERKQLESCVEIATAKATIEVIYYDMIDD